MRKTFFVLLLLGLCVQIASPAAGAKQATLVGKLLDDDGKPLANVSITVRGGEFEQSVTTDKRGRFKVAVPDAAAEYTIVFNRDGFPPHTEPLTFDPRGGSQGKEWTMSATPPTSITESMEALEAYNAAAQAYNSGDPDLAIDKFNEAVVFDPDFVEAHLLLARIHFQRASHEPAAKSAARVVELDPENVTALQVLYDAETALGRDSASATLDRLADVAPSPDVAVQAYNEGVAARREGDLQRARDRYALAAKIHPELGQAHASLADVLLELKDYDAALVSSGRALEIDAKDVRGNSIRYNTLIAMGRNDEAQAMLDELQTLAPEAVTAAYLERGTMLLDQGQVDSAIVALERAIVADPSSARAHYTLGLSYMSKGNADAKKHLEKFLELAPEDPDAESARQLIGVLSQSE